MIIREYKKLGWQGVHTHTDGTVYRLSGFTAQEVMHKARELKARIGEFEISLGNEEIVRKKAGMLGFLYGKTLQSITFWKHGRQERPLSP